MARCLTPILVQNPKRRDFVPCGKCNFCLETKRNDWSFRLNQEHHVSKTSIFLTLTYEDENLPYSSALIPTLSKRHYQLFTKTVRKQNARLVRWPLRYYSVGEYGLQFNRPHYHAIIFNLHNDVANSLQSHWKHGFIKFGTVTPASIHYVTKYVINHNDNLIKGRDPPFAVMSKRPGIGAAYAITHKQWHKDELRNFTMVNGVRSRLPRYYKDKMFTQALREQISEASLQGSDQSYWNEITRIAKTEPDPFNTYDTRVINAHDAITSKINLTLKQSKL